MRRQLADPGRIAPQSREAADHSLHFLIAVALIDGTFGLRQFDNERWNDPKVRALMARLEMTTDADLRPPRRRSLSVRAPRRGRDGRPYDVEILQPPGFSPDGLDAATALEKFARVTEGHLRPDTRSAVLDAVLGLDRATSCAGLMDLLVPAASVRV